ncbi:hypothetical protein Gotur_017201 [Gossypium turneri]
MEGAEFLDGAERIEVSGPARKDSGNLSGLLVVPLNLENKALEYAGILVSVGPGLTAQGDGGWIEHADFFDFVKKNWNFDGDLSKSLSNITSHLNEWNKKVYSHIGETIRFFENLYGEDPGPMGGLQSSSFQKLEDVGDGRNIRCWRDPWIPNVGPLINLIPRHASLDLDYWLNDMVVDNGTWNLDLFRLWLPETVIQKIISILTPYSVIGADRIILGQTRTDGFDRLEDGSVAATRVVRNINGEWITDFNRFLGTGTRLFDDLDCGADDFLRNPKERSKDFKNAQFCPVVLDHGTLLLLQVASFLPTASSEGDKICHLQSASLQFPEDKTCLLSLLHCNFREIRLDAICSLQLQRDKIQGFNSLHCNFREIGLLATDLFSREHDL